MGVTRASVNFQASQQHAAHAVVREHAPHRGAQRTIGELLELIAQGNAFDTARIARMAIVHFGVEAAVGASAGHGHVLAIHHDYIITHHHARREGRLMLAKQHVGNAGRQTAQILAVGIHKKTTCSRFR